MFSNFLSYLQNFDIQDGVSPYHFYLTSYCTKVNIPGWLITTYSASMFYYYTVYIIWWKWKEVLLVSLHHFHVLKWVSFARSRYKRWKWRKEMIKKKGLFKSSKAKFKRKWLLSWNLFSVIPPVNTSCKITVQALRLVSNFK